MREPIRAIDANATGTLDSGRGLLFGCTLMAAAATSTAVVRTGGGSGAVIARLSAVANTSVSWEAPGALAYADLHVTLTGASATFVAYV